MEAGWPEHRLWGDRGAGIDQSQSLQGPIAFKLTLSPAGDAGMYLLPSNVLAVGEEDIGWWKGLI